MMEKLKFSYADKAKKLKQLVKIENIDEDDVMMAPFRSVCIGICQNEWCDYTTDVEPDQDQGWCEVCNTKTVASIGNLNGMI